MGLLWTLGLGIAVATAALLHRAGVHGRRMMLLAVLLGVGVTGAGAAVAGQTGHYWNSVRTVIPVALAHGIPIYHRPGEGPLWANIYPPLGWAMLTPSALGGTPQVAIGIGQGLCALFVLGPLTLAGGWVRGSPRGQVLLFTLGVALAATAAIGPLQDVTYAVHVDAPALGLGMVACAMIMRAGRPGARKWLLASGAAAMASVFCKQTMLPLPAVLTIWALVKWGKTEALTVLLGVLAAGLLLVALVCAFFDPRALIYCIFTIPSRQGFGDNVGYAIRLGLIECVKWLLPVVVLTAFAVKRSVKLAGDDAVLFLLVASAEIPFAAAAYLKIGGDRNNLAYVIYFVLAALLCAIASAFRTQRTLIRITGAAGIVAAVVVGVTATLSKPGPNQHEVAYDLIKARPGMYYFPWLPLSHFMAEGRQTHQSWGIMDRLLASEPVEQAWLNQYLPPQAAFLCSRVEPSPADAAYARLAREYSRAVKLPELPGWYCYTKQ